MRESVAAGNATVGIVAEESGSGTTDVMVDRSAAVNNGIGISPQGAGATIRIGDSTVSIVFQRQGETTGFSLLDKDGDVRVLMEE